MKEPLPVLFVGAMFETVNQVGSLLTGALHVKVDVTSIGVPRVGFTPKLAVVGDNVKVARVHRAHIVVFAFITELAVNCVPPVGPGVLNHPKNTKSGLVSVGSVPTAVPCCTLRVVWLTVPSFGSNVTVIFCVHLAHIVVSAFITEAAVNCTPPVWALNHPANVKPALVGVGSAPTAAPGDTLRAVGLTVPPFALNVTVQFAAVHRAHIVVFALMIEFAVNCVPPVWAEVLNQPANVKPALVGVGSVPTAVPGDTLRVVGLTVPPFALNVTVALLTPAS